MQMCCEKCEELGHKIHNLLIIISDKDTENKILKEEMDDLRMAMLRLTMQNNELSDRYYSSCRAGC